MIKAKEPLFQPSFAVLTFSPPLPNLGLGLALYGIYYPGILVPIKTSKPFPFQTALTLFGVTKYHSVPKCNHRFYTNFSTKRWVHFGTKWYCCISEGYFTTLSQNRITVFTLFCSTKRWLYFGTERCCISEGYFLHTGNIMPLCAVYTCHLTAVPLVHPSSDHTT